MGGNRFEFLELGEEGEKQPQPAPDDPVEALLGGRDAIAERGPEGEPLAQVRLDSSLRYLGFMQESQQQSEADLVRSRLHLAPTILKVAEVVGKRGREVGEFNYPTGLAVDMQGVLFVADSDNHRVQRITPEGGVSPLGTRGSGRGQFLAPHGAATDIYNSFYIVEKGNHRLQKFAADGTLLMVIGKLGTRDGDFSSPTAIAVAPNTGDFYIADSGNHRVQRFDPSGYFLGTLIPPELPSHMAFNPHALAVDNEGALYVADPFIGRIWVFDIMGRCVNALRIRFTQPRALACADDGLVYVADSGSRGVEPMELDSGGRISVLNGPQAKMMATLNEAGRGLGSFARPGGLAVMPRAQNAARGDLYVSDTFNHRILRFAWE